MPRTSVIRWRDKDIINLRKTVSKFNAKLTRLTKAHPEFADFLPERLSVQQARENIHTRNDFNRFISSHERFMKKGAERPIVSESGAKTTEWQLNEVKRNIATINRRRAAELKIAAPSPYKGNMGSVEDNNLRPKKLRFDELPQSAWDKFVKQIERESSRDYKQTQLNIYKENYIKAAYNMLGNEAEELVDKIKNIPPDIFYRIILENYDILSIGFLYDDFEIKVKSEEILGRLEALGY